MSNQILVPLNRADRVEEITSYLEEIAKPEMKVVFLISYPMEVWTHVRGHWVTTESTREAISVGRKIMEQFCWKSQQKLAEREVAAACGALLKRGIEVAVKIYTGSLGSAVRDCAGDGDIHLIMKRAGGFLSWITVLFGLAQRSAFPPALLVRLIQR